MGNSFVNAKTKAIAMIAFYHLFRLVGRDKSPNDNQSDPLTV